jgi:hypothetical protein
MYDDRGLDIIAAELNTLRPLFESFVDWVLDNQRHRVAFRFRNIPNESSRNVLDPIRTKTGFLETMASRIARWVGLAEKSTFQAARLDCR